MEIKFNCETDIGKQRKVNEDTLWPKTDLHEYSAGDEYGMLFIVADGMGGHGAGDIASELAVQEISQIYYTLEDSYQDTEVRLRIAIRKAHEEIRDRASTSPDTRNMGTTVVAVVVKYNETDKRGEAWVAWVGDSRAYLLRDSQLKQLTEDHSKIWPLIKAGLSWDEQRLHPDRSKVTNSLATRRSNVTPDVKRFDLEPGDQLLLCSDGLSGEVRPNEIEQILKIYRLEDAVKLLIDKANAPKMLNQNGQQIALGGGDDNITVFVIEIPGGEQRLAAPAPKPISGAVLSKITASWPIVAVGAVLLLILLGVVAALIFGNQETKTGTDETQQVASVAPLETPNQGTVGVTIVDAAPTNTPESQPTLQEPTLAPGETREPTATPASRESTPPPTPTPTFTPVPQSSPTPTTSNLSNLSKPELLWPKPLEEEDKTYFTDKEETRFAWRWSKGSLPDNLSFEIRIWLEGTDPLGAYDARIMKEEWRYVENDQYGQYAFTFNLTSSPSVQEYKSSKDYLWSVGVVQIEPEYVWLGVESEPRRISIAIPGGPDDGDPKDTNTGGGGGGGGGTNPPPP